MTYVVLTTKDPQTATAIHQAQKDSTIVVRGGEFKIVLGKVGDKDFNAIGNFSNLTSVSILSRETLIP